MPGVQSVYVLSVPAVEVELLVERRLAFEVEQSGVVVEFALLALAGVRLQEALLDQATGTFERAGPPHEADSWQALG